MIASVSERGTIELFWRHPVSKNPTLAKARQFVAGLSSRSIVRLVRETSGGLSGTTPTTLDTASATFLADAIARGQCIVLSHRAELRWQGTRMPVTPVSPSILLLWLSRTEPLTNFGMTLNWLRRTPKPEEAEALWTGLWVQYGRGTADEAPAAGTFAERAEQLLRAGDLVPVFHPLPIRTDEVIQSVQADAGAAPSRTPPPPDPSTFDSDHAAAAQVAALLRAAQSGVASCEVCDREAKRPRLSWIAIELVDADGKAVAGEPYEVILPDGTVVNGSTDAAGHAGHDRIPEGTCKIRFPKRDRTEWELV